MLSRIRQRRWGVTAKMTMPFMIIFVLAIALLGTMFVRSQSAAITRTLEKKAEIEARNMATAWAGLVMTGGYTELQRLVDEAKTFDNDIAYATVLTAQGLAVASTDAASRNQTLNRNEFESSALKVKGFTSRNTSTQGTFEVVMPVNYQGIDLGVLRMGFTTTHVERALRQTQYL